MIGSGLPYGLHGVLDVLVDASVAMGDAAQALHYLDQLTMRSRRRQTSRSPTSVGTTRGPGCSAMSTLPARRTG